MTYDLPTPDPKYHHADPGIAASVVCWLLGLLLVCGAALFDKLTHAESTQAAASPMAHAQPRLGR